MFKKAILPILLIIILLSACSPTASNIPAAEANEFADTLIPLFLEAKETYTAGMEAPANEATAHSQKLSELNDKINELPTPTYAEYLKDFLVVYLLTSQETLDVYGALGNEADLAKSDIVIQETGEFFEAEVESFRNDPAAAAKKWAFVGQKAGEAFVTPRGWKNIVFDQNGNDFKVSVPTQWKQVQCEEGRYCFESDQGTELITMQQNSGEENLTIAGVMLRARTSLKIYSGMYEELIFDLRYSNENKIGLYQYNAQLLSETEGNIYTWAIIECPNGQSYSVRYSVPPEIFLTKADLDFLDTFIGSVRTIED